MLTTVLVKNGHIVKGLRLATDAVRALTQDHYGFDLILLDMILGEDQTGWMLAYFRAFDRRSRHIPMVVLSGMPREEIRFMAAQNVLHGVPVLEKPLDMAALERELAKL
jgi:response regulator RpfG family c-di-GMP phosphodiesterase